MGRPGRPRTEIGTYGKIRVKELPDGQFEARARFRFRNGTLRPVKRRAATAAAAVRKLKKAMAKPADEVAGKKIHGGTRMTHVMDLWLAEFADKVERGKRAPKSYDDYKDTIDNHLRPRMGELTCREAENAGLCNEVLKKIRDAGATAIGSKGGKRGKTGTAGMLRARTVLSGVCGLAVLHGAMNANPVKSIERIDHDDNEILALGPEQRRDFLAKFRAESIARAKPELGRRGAVWLDLPDIVEAQLSTGCRPSEILGMLDSSVDLDAGKVVADHHLVRVKGEGLRRVAKRKGGGAAVEPPILSWSLAMWRRRKLAAAPDGPLFPAWNGNWHDPSNVGKRVSSVCKEIGYEWVSQRILRHTTASHLVNSGLTSEDAADALGNTPDVINKHYRARQKANPRVAVALESLVD